METAVRAPRRLPGTIVPLIAAAVLFVVYAATLNPWLSVHSAGPTVSAAGWPGAKPSVKPLLWLAMAPLSTLPVSAFVPAANALAALCAALAAASLARCVALLPHDRDRGARLRGHEADPLLHTRFAWAPPAMAAALLGFQLTFWEHATAQTGETLDLLVFAACVQCLLEFRVSRRTAWLWRFAFLWGVGAANDAAMIGFAPFWAAALCWSAGLEAARIPVLARLALWAGAGLLLYLLLPAVGSLRGEGFWDHFRYALASQKALLLGPGRARVLVLAAVNVLPLGFLAVRWRQAVSSTEGWIESAVQFGVSWAALLGNTAMAFDPGFSQRKLAYLDPASGGYALLTFYFCGALAASWVLGRLLLQAVEPAVSHWTRKDSQTRPLRLAGAAVAVAVAAVSPTILAIRNQPRVALENRPWLRNAAGEIASALPQQPALIATDDPLLFALIEAEVRQAKGDAPRLPLNLTQIPDPSYRRRLFRERGDIWPNLRAFAAATNEVVGHFETFWSGPIEQGLAFYANPAVNFLLQEAYQFPAGVVFQLKRFPTTAIEPPPLGTNETARVVGYWQSRRAGFEATAEAAAGGSLSALWAAQFYSRAANTQGVDLQRSGQAGAATLLFEMARQLDTNNLPAQANLTVNRALLQGRPIPEAARKGLNDIPPELLFSLYGPTDEPNALTALGSAAMRSTPMLLRSAAIYFLRARQLDPGQTMAWLGFIAASVNAQEFQLAIDTSESLRKRGGLTKSQSLALLRMESHAMMARADFQGAERLVTSARQSLPEEPEPVAILSELYLNQSRTNDALSAAAEWVRMAPADHAAHFRHGIALMKAGRFQEAVAEFDKSLAAAPDDESSRANRAISRLQLNRLEDAWDDFTRLEKLHPDSPLYQYGLGETAFRQTNFAAAAEHFSKYLKTANKRAAEYEEVAEKLKRMGKTP